MGEFNSCGLLFSYVMYYILLISFDLSNYLLMDPSIQFVPFSTLTQSH